MSVFSSLNCLCFNGKLFSEFYYPRGFVYEDSSPSEKGQTREEKRKYGMLVRSSGSFGTNASWFLFGWLVKIRLGVI